MINFFSRLIASIIIRCGRFIPDRIYIKALYYRSQGKKLNLSNPQTFTEKLQWLKLYDRKEEYSKLVDKEGVKGIVASRIGAEYIIPSLGCWNSFDEIDFEQLPSTFVLKTTHDSGGVVICRNKETLDIAEAKRILESSQKKNFYYRFREFPYKKVCPRIIAEKYIETTSSDLTDYKIYCFNGRPCFIQVISDRSTEKKMDFFDVEWRHQEFTGLSVDAKKSVRPNIPRPKHLEKMLEIAAQLSKGHPFLRVDLYNIDGVILFGELTFFPNAGFGKFTPDEWNNKLGKMIDLSFQIKFYE